MPKINLTWNQIIGLLLMGLQMAVVGNLITDPVAIRWMLFAVAVIRGGQLYLAGITNPDGSAIEAAALVTKTATTTETTIEPRKDAPVEPKP